MNKTYFKYLLNSKKNILIFLAVINLLFPALIYFISISASLTKAIAGTGTTIYDCVTPTCLLLFAECIFIPILFFNFIHSQKGCDTYLAIPVSRKELFITSYVMSVFSIVCTHLLSFTIVWIADGIICSMDGFTPMVSLAGYILYSIGCIFVICSMTLGVCALILKTNTSLDAFIVICFYILLPILIYSVLYILIQNQAYGVNPYGHLKNYLSYVFVPVALVNSFPQFMDRVAFEYKYYLIFITILLIAGISFIRDIKLRKAEDAQQISSNIFTFPLMIATVPITFLLDVIFSELDFKLASILIIIIFILYSILICVYKRKIHFSKKAIVLFFTMIIVGYSLLFVSDQTNAFGIETSYQNKTVIKSCDAYYSFRTNLNTNYYIFISASKTNNKTIEDVTFVNYIHQKQHKYLQYAKTNEDAEEYKPYNIYQSFSVSYKNDEGYSYDNYELETNSTSIQKIIEEFKLFKNYDFVKIDISKDYTDENGNARNSTISLDTFINEMEEIE